MSGKKVELLTARQASLVIGIGVDAVKTQCKKGNFPGASKVANQNGTPQWMIPSNEVEAYASREVKRGSRLPQDLIKLTCYFNASLWEAAKMDELDWPTDYEPRRYNSPEKGISFSTKFNKS